MEITLEEWENQKGFYMADVAIKEALKKGKKVYITDEGKKVSELILNTETDQVEETQIKN